MKTVPRRWRAWLPALVLTWLTATSMDRETASARALAGWPIVTPGAAPQCDPNRLIHAMTHEYRMLYDQRYASAQRIAAASNLYRRFYDQKYIAEQQIAVATREYCRGGQ